MLVWRDERKNYRLQGIQLSASRSDPRGGAQVFTSLNRLAPPGAYVVGEAVNNRREAVQRYSAEYAEAFSRWSQEQGHTRSHSEHGS